MLFKITYKNQKSDEFETVVVTFYDSARFSALEKAHEYAYSLVDKGWYIITKLKNKDYS